MQTFSFSGKSLQLCIDTTGTSDATVHPWARAGVWCVCVNGSVKQDKSRHWLSFTFPNSFIQCIYVQHFLYGSSSSAGGIAADTLPVWTMTCNTQPFSSGLTLWELNRLHLSSGTTTLHCGRFNCCFGLGLTIVFYLIQSLKRFSGVVFKLMLCLYSVP